jgi:arylsulfatase A-like enzyme
VIRRREFLAAPALLAQPRRPLNILLLFPDQWRPDWMPSLGPVRTPNLEKLAARGVRFSNALTPAPLCAPARACLASGKEYSRCGVASNGVDYPLEQTTFYTLLQRAGYHTMACGKVDLHKKSHIWGLDGKTRTREWGFSDAIDNAGKGDAIASGAESPKDPYMAMLHARSLARAHVDDFRRRSKEGYAATWNTPLPDDAYCDNWIGRNALSLLSAAPKDKPWFLQVNFTGPHNPMDITARMEPPVRGRPMPAPQHCSLYDTATHQRIRQNYSAMCDNIDRLCGDILARVDLDNTLVVFSSDHGEMLGDHNKWGKTYPYQASAGVPLLIAARRSTKAPPPSSTSAPRSSITPALPSLRTWTAARSARSSKANPKPTAPPRAAASAPGVSPSTAAGNSSPASIPPPARTPPRAARPRFSSISATIRPNTKTSRPPRRANWSV